MNEVLYAALFWMVLPAVALGRRGRSGWVLVLLLPIPAAAFLLAAGPFGRSTGPAAAGAVAGAAGLALFLARRSAYRASRRIGGRLRGLRAEARRARSRVESLAREVGTRRAFVERLQNRFALVQGMATRLDAEVLLQSLGGLWSEVPGIRRVMLLQRKPNGNWGVSFARGFSSPEDWAALLETYPGLTLGKRLRKVSSLDRFPLLKGKGPEPPFYLVPVAWGEDVMALGYLESSEDLFKEGEAGFNTERKLASIGLRRARLFDLMTERSRHDGLTGAFLRRTFLERLGESVRKSLRYRTPFFVVVFDIDRFKSINDVHGHPVGDRALVRTAQIVRDLAEPGITLGRMGGDEFALLIEMPTLREVLDWTERFRARIAGDVLRENGREVRFTISLGVSAFRPEDPSPEGILARADEALYRSKSEGRNRVSVDPSALAPGGR